MVKRDLIRNMLLLLMMVLLVLGLRYFVFRPFVIDEKASNAYLKANDLVLVNQWSQPRSGDFLLYRAEEQFHVSRLIAQAGDSVTFMDDVLYIDNEIVDEPYLDDDSGAEYFTLDFNLESLTQSSMSTIPADHFLLLNDNRHDTQDSRQFGLIAKKDIIGVIRFRLSPLSDFGFIDNGTATPF